MFESFTSAHPLLGVYDKQFLNEIFGQLGHSLELRMIEVILSLFDFVENISSILTLKRKVAAHENVHEYPE